MDKIMIVKAVAELKRSCPLIKLATATTIEIRQKDNWLFFVKISEYFAIKRTPKQFKKNSSEKTNWFNLNCI